MNFSLSLFESVLDRIIDRALEEQFFPGIAAGVWVDNTPLYLRYAGFADPPQEAVGQATLFDAASLTKPLATAVLIMKAVEAGELGLSQPLGHFFDDMHPATAEIPLSSLLTHTSGLPAIPALERFFPTASLLSKEKASDILLHITPEQSPGLAVNYSCTGYLLLGLVLEKIYGMPIGKLFKKEIAGPLGLKRSGFAANTSESGEPEPLMGAAATEYCAWRGRRIKGQVHDESAYCMGGQAGNAGLFVTLEEAARIGFVFLNNGVCEGTHLLEPDSVLAMTTDRVSNFTERRGCGFKLHGPDTPDGPFWPVSTFCHTGFTGTSICAEPKRKLLVILLTNRVYYGREKTANTIVAFRKEFHSAVWQSLFNP